MQMNYPPSHALHLSGVGFKPSAIAALGATADLVETPIGSVGPTSEGVALGSVIINPGPGTLTASDTLFRTITITKRTAGGSPVTIAVGTTKTTGSGGTGSWAAWTPVSFAALPGATLAANDSISISIIHASTGTAIPASILELVPAVF